MSSPYADFKRDGLNQLLKIARTLCGLVTAFAAIIRSKYSDYPPIILLLDAIEAVCEQLPAAQASFDAFGFDDPTPPTNTGEINGINPSAPEAPEPDTV